ncbi:hypothetical protein FXO37_27917 [Capsicum annuum]|nr:hypothetical protein FXO37_27917 [Capsicum annuum]
MDVIIEAVLVQNCVGFSVGHKVATFLRNYLLRQDGTVTSFVRALKCLHEAGRYHKVALLDLYLEALDPELYKSRLSNHDCDNAKDKSLLSDNDKLFKLQKAKGLTSCEVIPVASELGAAHQRDSPRSIENSLFTLPEAVIWSAYTLASPVPIRWEYTGCYIASVQRLGSGKRSLLSLATTMTTYPVSSKVRCLIVLNRDIKLADMVHFRYYTSLSSKSNYLLIEADDGMVLTRLLTETPIVGRYADPWPPLQNSLYMLDWNSEHEIGANRSVKAFFEAWCPTTYTLLTSVGELSISLWNVYKIGGLSIGGLSYEEVVLEVKELTYVDEKNGRFIPCSCESLFIAFQHLQEGEASNLRVSISPIVDTPQEHGEEVPIVVKDPILKPRVKPSLAKQGDSNSYVEILSSLSKTPPAIEKPNNVQDFENPHQSKPQDSSETIVGPDSRELPLSSKEARKKVKKLKDRRDVAKQEDAEIESKVSTAEEEFSKCSDVSLATENVSNFVEKKNQVLETALQNLD